jgi:hypothetical protein
LEHFDRSGPISLLNSPGPRFVESCAVISR